MDILDCMKKFASWPVEIQSACVYQFQNKPVTIHDPERPHAKKQNRSSKEPRMNAIDASDQPIVMLRVEAEHYDGTYYAERKAPMLPSCVFWHAGMWYSDEIDAMEVDSIRVDEAGRVTVHFHERYGSPVSEDAKRQFSENGWTIASAQRS